MAFSHNISHQKLTEAKTLLGFSTDKGGICRGVTAMWMQAVLCQEEEKFWQRLQLISTTPDLIMKIYKAKNTPEENLTSSEQDLLEIEAFFYGVDAYQNSIKHVGDLSPYLQADETYTDQISKLVMSEKIRQRGGIVNLYSSPAIFSETGWGLFFENIKMSLNSKSRNLVPMMVSGSGHQIGILYLPEKDQWEVFDVNAPTSLLVPDVRSLVSLVYFAILGRDSGEEEEVFLHVSAHALKDYAELISLKTQFAKLEQQNLLVMDVNRQSAEGKTLIHEAAYINSLTLLKSLLGRGAKIDNVDNLGWSAAHFAAQEGNLSILVELVERGAKLGLETVKGETPAHLAAWYGHIHLIRFFIEKRIPLTKPNKDGYSPFYFMFGASKNKIEMITEVLLSLLTSSIISSEDLDKINAYREKLVKGFILRVKSASETEKRVMLDDFMNQRNAFSQILHSPRNYVGFLFTKRRFQDRRITESVGQVLDAFPDIVDELSGSRGKHHP